MVNFNTIHKIYRTVTSVAMLGGATLLVGCAAQRPVDQAENERKAYITAMKAVQEVNLKKLEGWVKEVEATKANLLSQNKCVGAAMAEGFRTMDSAREWADFKAKYDFLDNCRKPDEVSPSGQRVFYNMDSKMIKCGSVELALPSYYQTAGQEPNGNWAVVFYCSPKEN